MSRFDDLTQDERDELRVEFNRDSTTDERRLEIITMVQEGANEAKFRRPCPRCKNHPFMIPHDRALLEGHVYSDAGYEEVRITGYCEFCFDLITAESDEDDDEIEGPQ